jgi:hypothetical protein
MRLRFKQHTKSRPARFSGQITDWDTSSVIFTDQTQEIVTFLCGRFGLDNPFAASNHAITNEDSAALTPDPGGALPSGDAVFPNQGIDVPSPTDAANS